MTWYQAQRKKFSACEIQETKLKLHKIFLSNTIKLSLHKKIDIDSRKFLKQPFIRNLFWCWIERFRMNVFALAFYDDCSSYLELSEKTLQDDWLDKLVESETPKSEVEDLRSRPQGRVNSIWVWCIGKGLQREHKTQKDFQKNSYPLMSNSKWCTFTRWGRSWDANASRPSSVILSQLI